MALHFIAIVIAHHPFQTCILQRQFNSLFLNSSILKALHQETKTVNQELLIFYISYYN